MSTMPVKEQQIAQGQQGKGLVQEPLGIPVVPNGLKAREIAEQTRIGRAPYFSSSSCYPRQRMERMGTFMPG